MQTQIVKLELRIKEKTYTFLCDCDSPIDDVKESLLKFIKHAEQVEDSIRSQQAKIELEKQEEKKQE